MSAELRASPWDVAARTPDHPALIFADTGERRSYGQMMRNANRLAHRLLATGLQPGDCIAILMENRAEFLDVVWAAKQLGIYYVCLPVAITPDDASYIIANSGTRVLITSDQIETAGEIRARAGQNLLAAWMAGTPLAGFTGLDDAMASQPDTMVEGRHRGISMLYSSGTTGRPKGVRHRIEPVSPHIAPPRHAYLKPTYDYGPHTVFANPGPFYHTAPLRMMLHVQREGGTAIVYRKFDAETVLRSIEIHGATNGMFVPTMFVRMLNLPQDLRDSVDVSSMRHALHGAAPIAPVIKQQMIDWWGDCICEIYGGTESIGTTIISAAEWRQKPGSVGRASPGTRIRIEAPDGSDCAPGEQGLILMTQGKAFEYHGDPDKTAEATRPGGWATLGDIGYVDADGYLFLTDRASHLIISGGVNVYPQEAEHVLTAHPAVAEVAVIGLPDPDFGERVHGLVVLRDGIAVDPEDLIAFCRDRIGKIKTPRTLEFIDSLPRNALGKVLKKELRQRYAGAPN